MTRNQQKKWLESLRPGAVVKLRRWLPNWRRVDAYLKLQPNGRYIQVYPEAETLEESREFDPTPEKIEPITGDEYRNLLMEMFEEVMEE